MNTQLDIADNVKSLLNPLRNVSKAQTIFYIKWQKRGIKVIIACNCIQQWSTDLHSPRSKCDPQSF